MIRVASYNMRKAIGTDRRRRPERTIEVLNELDADVIALQEADRRFGSRASAIPLAMLERTATISRSQLDSRDGSDRLARQCAAGAARTSRCASIISSICPRWSRAARCWPTSCVDGVLLRVVGMHLDLSGLWRRQQAQAILAHLHERETASRRPC